MMKVAALLAVLLVLFHPRPSGAQPKCAQRWADEGLNLAGRVAGMELRMYLHFGHPAEGENSMSGVFLYPTKWTPGKERTAAEFGVDGTVTNDCQIELRDSAEGAWRLRFVTPQRLQGSLKPPVGRSTDVTLRVVPATDCSGRTAWRTFSSPRWPITFDYPVSWRLAVEANNIFLECPDAKELAWGGTSIWLKLGKGTERIVTEDARKGTRIDRFVRFDNGTAGTESVAAISGRVAASSTTCFGWETPGSLSRARTRRTSMTTH
jgi:hypothetical protein